MHFLLGLKYQVALAEAFRRMHPDSESFDVKKCRKNILEIDEIFALGFRLFGLVFQQY